MSDMLFKFKGARYAKESLKGLLIDVILKKILRSISIMTLYMLL